MLTELKYEYCAVCGKPCGEKLNPRGEVKVFHWDCFSESVKESREHYQNMMKRLADQQKQPS